MTGESHSVILRPGYEASVIYDSEYIDAAVYTSFALPRAVI